MGDGLPPDFDTNSFVKQFVARVNGKANDSRDTIKLSNGKKLYIVHPFSPARSQGGQSPSNAADKTKLISPVQAITDRAEADVAREHAQGLVNRRLKHIKRSLPDGADVAASPKKKKPAEKKSSGKKRLVRDIYHKK